MERLAGPLRDWVSRFGSVVHLLIWVNVAVFILQLICTMVRWPVMDQVFALSGTGLRHGFFWQPLTYMFLHDTHSLWHIVANLLFLWFFGREVEYFIGPKYFTRLFFLGGFAGAALWLAFNFQYPDVVLGASAAVLACVIAFATLFPDREVTLLVFFILPVTLKAKYLALVAVALDVVPLLSHTSSNVAHLAHIGGAAMGYLYIKQLGYGRTPRWLEACQTLGSGLRFRRRPSARELSPEEFVQQQVDPILDKISREGLQSLTRAERKILDSARARMEKPSR